MSETTATRKSLILGAAVLGAAAWVVAASFLWRTSVPHLHLGGFDEHRHFSAHELARAHSYGTGEDVLWLLRTLAKVAALVVLVRRAPAMVRGFGLGRIGSAIVVGMVVLVTLWFVSLPFSLAELWWQHHWGLGPFHPLDWLLAQDASLPAEAVFATWTIALAVGLAARFRRWWWLAAVPAFTAIAVLFGFRPGWLGAANTHAVRSASLRARVVDI